MDYSDFTSYLQALFRWIHVFSAILWIGQTYLFNFLEKNLEPDADQKNLVGKLWMVHGGGFYLVEKQRVPTIMPLTLHWFKWEAASTWLSGVVLIGLTYYAGGLLVEPGMNYITAVAAGIGVVIVGWVGYDALVRSPLGRTEWLVGVLGFCLLLLIHVGLKEVLSSRAAFIHVGALIGTIMAANVWIRILPSQRKMIALAAAGEEPSVALSRTAPLRSKHNSYLVISLVFIMISNHYPSISYGSDQSTVVLGGLILLGAAVARVFRGRERRAQEEK